MKNLTFFGIILQFISVILLLISNINYPLYYLVMFILLIIVFIFMIKNKDINYLVSMFILGYFSIYIFTITSNPIYISLYFIGFLLNILYGYFYIFNNINNKMNIKLNKIELPKNKDYIVIKYLTGLDIKYIGNGIIYKENGNLVIEVENDKIDKVYKKIIKRDELKTINSTVKPYIVSRDKVLVSSIDHSKSYFSGHVTKDNENTIYTKDIKPIKSFIIEITLLNGKVISLLSFNDPEKFFVK